MGLNKDYGEGMLEESGDFWLIEGDYRCINTNAFLKKGSAVMGKGIALQAARKYPGLGIILGKLIQINGNHVFHLGNGLISFPTKWNFRDIDVELIKQSSQELIILLQDDPAKRILIERPEDGIQWTRIKPVIQKILRDDKFIIVNKEKKRLWSIKLI
jgi:hypothetical protein